MCGKSLFAAFGIGLTLVAGYAYAGDQLDVREAWIRWAPPAVKVHGAYFQLTNNGDRTVTLKGVKTKRYEKAEIHRTEMKNNMARMKKIDAITVKPGETVRFAPGGYHVMLVTPKGDIKEKDVIKLDLIFEGFVKNISAVVQRQHGVQQHHHH